MFRKLLLLTALLVPGAAQATWRQAVTTHFILYSEGSTRELQAEADDLERHEFFMRKIWKIEDVTDPIKVKVYVVANEDAVQKTMPFPSDGVAGYYDSSVRATYAVVMRYDGSQDDNDGGLSPQQVLFHELTHHFMFQYFPGTYPVWYSEGFADFMGAIRIQPNNGFRVGMPVMNRYISIGVVSSDWIDIGKLLTSQSYRDAGGRVDLLYAEGWALVHYLWFEKKREGQLQEYLRQIQIGKAYTEAAQAAFGDLRKLNTELRAYVRRTALPTQTMAFPSVDVGPITIGPVTPAQNALMLFDISLNSGVPAGTAKDFAAAVRLAAKPFPDDPYALRIVAEADRLVGDQDEEAKTVQHWINVAPRDPLALMHQSKIATDQLKAAKSTEAAAWDKARRPLLTGIRLDQTNPELLKAYYDSFVDQGILPPPGAQSGLYKALDLVPQDSEVRYKLAVDFETRGLVEDAIAIIKPDALASANEAGASAKEKAKLEKERTKYRLAGDVDHETAYEMYIRLTAKLEGKKPGDTPAPN